MYLEIIVFIKNNIYTNIASVEEQATKYLIYFFNNGESKKEIIVGGDYRDYRLKITLEGVFNIVHVIYEQSSRKIL